MATLDDQDLRAIRDLIDVELDETLDEKLGEKLSHLPTKDEFYEKMDEVMRELQAMREEVSVLSHQVADHDDRLEKVESHLGISSN